MMKDDKFEENKNEEEKLHFEIEFLKMKMQAEYGAWFGSSENLPPHVEYEFLQSVLQFEEACRNNKTPPEFNKVEVDNLCSRDVNFFYKVFHPDHKKEIERCVVQFIEGFLMKEVFAYSNVLNEQFVLPDGRQLGKQEVIKKIVSVAESFHDIYQNHYVIKESAFQWNDETQCGLGHAEGIFQFENLSKSGEKERLEEKFKFYLSNEGLGWSIFYFVFPGFEW